MLHNATAGMIYTKHYACGTQHQILSLNACDIGTEKATIFTESQSVGPENSRLQHSRVRFSGTLHKTLFELFETGCFKNTKNHVTPLSFLQIKCLQSKCQQYFLGSTFDFFTSAPKTGQKVCLARASPVDSHGSVCLESGGSFSFRFTISLHS